MYTTLHNYTENTQYTSIIMFCRSTALNNLFNDGRSQHMRFNNNNSSIFFIYQLQVAIKFNYKIQ